MNDPMQQPDPPSHPTFETFARWTRRLCRVAGIAGILLCSYALLDPSIMADASSASLAPPSPRWRAALGLAMSVLVFGYGMRAEAHRNRE